MAVPSADQTAREPNKLILCFDGTGNAYTGSNADTNVVKILHKLDRHHPKQYHYYQTGVGTYDINEQSVHKTWLGEMRSSFSKTLDQAIGTTFDSHVMAGYRFLMRYYETGDKIYMFGFSRGAFTARFLARMIHTVGLLCKGNEELVPFAYRLYQRYLAGEVEKKNTAASGPTKAGNASEAEPLLNGQSCDHHSDETTLDVEYEAKAFASTFCRKEPTVENPEANVKVFFLGMWDCVNSVAVFEGSSPIPVPVKGTANYVRHAVAADERRVKFKAALLDQDHKCTHETNKNTDDIKEVWFPGCHGDVGGGWPASEKDHVTFKPASENDADKPSSENDADKPASEDDADKPASENDADKPASENDADKPASENDADKQKLTAWKKFKNFWFTHRPKRPSKNWQTDAFQMSDVALSWMIDELELIEKIEPSSAVKWSENAKLYKDLYKRRGKKQALRGVIHDSLVFGGYAAFFKVLMWRIMEVLPIMSRWELVIDKRDNKKYIWDKVFFPLNKGSYRDIPSHAVLHESLRLRLENVTGYAPANNHGGEDTSPCLIPENFIPFEYKLDKSKLPKDKAHPSEGHTLYTFRDTVPTKLPNGRVRA